MLSTAILTMVLCIIIILIFRSYTGKYYKEIVDAHIEYYSKNMFVKDGQLYYQNTIPEPTVMKVGIRDKRNTYIEIIDTKGQVVYFSENYNGCSLQQSSSSLKINNETVKVTSHPVIIENATVGKIFVGVATGDAENLMRILLTICLIGYFFIFILLFIISRFIAQNSIKPIRNIISTANSITHENLSARIPLPIHTDELYELSETINNLLARIEYALEREKSFTSYASHEFRTPLSILKGTMEVLIRRSRSEAAYKEKITECIQQVDKLNEMVEQLLILTRHEQGNYTLNYEYCSIEDMIDESVSLYCDEILQKKMHVKTHIYHSDISIYTDKHSLSIILNNLLSNAVKYSFHESCIHIKVYSKEGRLSIDIQNSGERIPPEELTYIFEKFYRCYTSEKRDVKGFGLGLCIVKHFCTILNIDIQVYNETNQVITARLTFPQITHLKETLRIS